MELGLSIQTPFGQSLDLSSSYDGIGVSDYQAISGQAAVRLPLN